jgi:N-acetylglucosaminyldiphosphoundecaprenol N-acetyl-beta-D-mannosaminyltransferase
MPFVYWIRLCLGVPCDQFDGSSLLIKLAEKAKEKNYTFFLYGGDPEIVKNMKKNIESRYPYIRIVGFISPPFRLLTEQEDRDFCDQINSLKPDIILVGLGTPKQDYWIDDHIYKIRGSVMINSGALFDFFGGRIKRAPRIISILCLEWLYRLCSKDFKRLWRRYTILNLIFLWNFFLQVIGLKVIKRERLKRVEV